MMSEKSGHTVADALDVFGDDPAAHAIVRVLLEYGLEEGLWNLGDDALGATTGPYAYVQRHFGTKELEWLKQYGPAEVCMEAVKVFLAWAHKHNPSAATEGAAADALDLADDRARKSLAMLVGLSSDATLPEIVEVAMSKRFGTWFHRPVMQSAAGKRLAVEIDGRWVRLVVTSGSVGVSEALEWVAGE